MVEKTSPAYVVSQQTRITPVPSKSFRYPFLLTVWTSSKLLVEICLDRVSGTEMVAREMVS
jgi:hypothetical protein